MSRPPGKPKPPRHAQQGSKTEQLAARLREWAVQCGYDHSDGLPSTDELKTLLRGSSSSSAWRHITQHVHHPSHVELVKKNLALATGPAKGSVEREQALRERADLQRELSSLKLAVGQLDTDISRVQADISSLDAANALTKAEVGELERKRALLSALSVKAEETASITVELAHRIAHRTEAFKRKPVETSYFARSESHSQTGIRNVVLESACKRRVRQVCSEDVEELLRTLAAAGSAIQQSSEEVQRLRQQAWTKLEGLLADFSPGELLSSLTELALATGRELATHTSAIDLKKDAQALRYRYEQGTGMVPAEQQSAPLRSVEEHLTGAQLAHLRRSVELEQRRKAALNTQGKLAGVKGQIDGLLAALYKQDGEGLELARHRVVLSLEVSGLAGSLTCLVVACRDLQATRARQREAHSVLQDKLHHISQFTATSGEKQSEIQALVKLNSAARSRLIKQRTELEHYVRERVCGHEVELVALGARLLDALGSEVTLLLPSLSLARALTPPGASTAQCDLSISRLHPSQPSGAPSWSRLASLLCLRPWSAPDRLLPLLIALQDRVGHLESQLEEEGGARLEVQGQLAVKEDKLQELLLRSHQCSSQQLSEGVPAARECLSQASQAIAHCSLVEHTLKEWWEEPGKLCVPWVTYEGGSVAKWTEQWRVLIAKLRELTQHTS